MDIKEAQFITGAAGWAGLPKDGLPEVAFIGRSNVGKSSLLNLITGRRQLARTSGTPGKTQQLNFYLINNSLYFVDLPGFGYARVARTQREKWGKLIGRYLAERPTLRLVIHLVDSRHPPTTLDRDVIELMRGSSVPYVIALTKTDKLSGNERTKSLKQVQEVLASYAMEVPLIQTSATARRGREEILSWIESVT